MTDSGVSLLHKATGGPAGDVLAGSAGETVMRRTRRGRAEFERFV